MINLMDELKKIGAGLVFVIITIFIFSYFKFDMIDRMVYLIIINGLFLLIVSLVNTGIFPIYKFLINSGHIMIFISLLSFVGHYGVFGYVGSIFLICFLIIFKRWKKYVEVKEHIEALIWGKPLKEYVKEGKRPPKIEFIK